MRRWGVILSLCSGSALAAQADPRLDEPPVVSAIEGPAVFSDCADLCPEMVAVPGGEATIGAPDTEPGRTPDEVRTRAVATAFAMGRYEVTRAEYAAFSQATGRPATTGCPTDRRTTGTWSDDATASWRDPGFVQSEREPVVCVSFADAEAYAAWLSARTGQAYRLPTEAEFEYAARAGAATAYWWGETAAGSCAFANGRDAAFKTLYPADATALECDDGFAHTAPVGSFWANGFGLSDIIGNVWEWTATCFVGCERRVQRGGGWGAGAVDLRSAQRVGVLADTRDASTGFRVVRDPGSEKAPPVEAGGVKVIGGN